MMYILTLTNYQNKSMQLVTFLFFTFFPVLENIKERGIQSLSVDDWNYQEYYTNLGMPIGCRGFSLNYPTQLNTLCLDGVDNCGCVLHHSNTENGGIRLYI